MECGQGYEGVVSSISPWWRVPWHKAEWQTPAAHKEWDLELILSLFQRWRHSKKANRVFRTQLLCPLTCLTLMRLGCNTGLSKVALRWKSESSWKWKSCLILCDPMDCSSPGSFVHGILQARILEWVATPFSRGSSRPRDPTLVSCTAGRFFTIWTTSLPRFPHYSRCWTTAIVGGSLFHNENPSF